ncbi:PTS lactose/cellobiose transporter subunit IIA [Clostridium perfringens]|nr:PTS lactose/cellobiose transporter subunit IIA [Clostridium perfringens]
MENQKNMGVIMNLIIYGGNARSNAIEAAKKGDFKLAKAKILDAESSLLKAHNSQTSLLSEEANGDLTIVSLLMGHGQDHLMTAITFIDLAKEIINVYEKILLIDKNVKN